MDTGTIAAIIGIVCGFITMIGGLWRVFDTVASLKKRNDFLEDAIRDGDRELEHQLEKIQLTLNGIRERMEHINTRVSNQLKEQSTALHDMEAFLVKKTEFERRNRS